MLKRSLSISGCVALAGCVLGGTAAPSSPRSIDVIREPFDDPAAIQANWVAVTPMVVGASAYLEEAALRMTMPENAEGEVVFRHRLDVSGLRGKRLRMTARVKADVSGESFAGATFVVATSQVQPSYEDRTDTQKVSSPTWRNIQAVIDVDLHAAGAELSLVLHGPGRAWFDDVTIQIVSGSTSRQSARLSRQQLDNVIALTRAVALIRYLHPSDQAANLDWDSFLPVAIDRILRMPDAAHCSAS